MLHKKVYTAMFVFTMLFLFNFTSHAAAKDPTAYDCLENKANCEDDIKDSGSETELETDQNKTEQLPEFGKSSSLFLSLVKMAFALLLVLALIYLLLKFLRKRNKLFHQVTALENLGGISVGQNKSIQVVRIGTKVFLVGVGENVEMLQEITDEEVKHDLVKKEENEGSPSQVSQWLPSFLQRKTNENNGDDGFKQLFSEELDKLKQNRKKIINRHKQKEDEPHE